MRVKIVLSIVIGLILAPSGFGAGILQGLAPADLKRIEAGEQVLITKAMEGYPWPQAQIFQRTDLSASALMSVFFDYDQAFRYVPNCKISVISKQISPVVAEVDYEVEVPILANECYTAENSLKRLPHGGYAVYWRLIRATNIESSIGSLYVEPYKNGSILRYTSLIKPASKAAVLLRGIAISQMKDTVNAIVSEAETLDSKSPNVVKGKITAMETALNTDK